MGDNGVTPSKDLVDAKILEYQISEYGNQLIITKNRLKSTYSLGWGRHIKAMISKIQYFQYFGQARYDYDVIVIVNLKQDATFKCDNHTCIYDYMDDIQYTRLCLFQ